MSTFSQCNTGALIKTVHWTLGGGTIPAGVSVIFQDAADLALGQVSLAAGAVSADVPATVDASKIASIHFSVNGSTIPNWNFCLSTVTVSYQ